MRIFWRGDGFLPEVDRTVVPFDDIFGEKNKCLIRM